MRLQHLIGGKAVDNADTLETINPATLARPGDLITRHMRELARIEMQDTGQTINQTGKQLVPRAADN